MPTTMRAAVVRAFGQPLTIEDVPVPDPGPGGVLVKIEATGVCHTDLHAADGDWPVRPSLPFVPGHEGAGIVAALGAGVKNLKKGDAFGIAWLHDACGMCEFCLTGWETLCTQQRNSGYSDRRLVPRLGHAQTIGAIAHRLCRLIWKILHQGIRYEERGPAVSVEAKKVLTRKMIRELRTLGYQVELLPAPSSNPA